MAVDLRAEGHRRRGDEGRVRPIGQRQHPGALPPGGLGQPHRVREVARRSQRDQQIVRRQAAQCPGGETGSLQGREEVHILPVKIEIPGQEAGDPAAAAESDHVDAARPTDRLHRLGAAIRIEATTGRLDVADDLRQGRIENARGACRPSRPLRNFSTGARAASKPRTRAAGTARNLRSPPRGRSGSRSQRTRPHDPPAR